MKTTDKEYFEIEAQHFLMDFFAEVPTPYIISSSFNLEDSWDEIRAFIGENDIRNQYNKVWADIDCAAKEHDDTAIITAAGELGDLLFREFHPRYPVYDMTNRSFCFPEDPEGWLGVEVTVDSPPQPNNE